MGVVHDRPYEPMQDDPDDYRPASAWALHVDPDRQTQLAVIRERIEVGTAFRGTGTTSKRWSFTRSGRPGFT